MLSCALLPFPAYATGQGLVYDLVIKVMGLLVRLAAAILNFGVNTFVIGFGDVFANSGVGVAVDSIWIIIRDFVNMGFIFGFVYIGFKIILNSGDSNTRRWIPQLLIAALLVNFSLFATKFVVDVSNQLAAQIAVGGLRSEGPVLFDDKTGLAKLDIGQGFLTRMGITTVLNAEGAPTNDWGYIFGTAILLLVTAFVFAAGGILLIIRFAVLNLFLVLSPIMFLGWVLPALKRDFMGEYWGMFLGRAFFAPIYLLFLYFSFQIITGLQTATSVASGTNNNLANPQWAGAFGAVQGSNGSVQEATLGTVPFFILICVFMIASLVIASKMGADGGARAVALGQQLRNKVQRGVTNTGKFAAAQTGGRLARAGADRAGSALNSGLRRAQTIQGDGLLARATRRVSRTNAVSGTVGGAVASAQNARFGLSRTRTEDRAMQNRTDTNAQNRTDIDTARAVTPITVASTPDEIRARQDARTRAQNEVRGLSNDEIIQRARINGADVMSPEFASLLSDAQVNALRESGVLTNEQSDELATNREEGTFAEITTVLESGNASTENLTAAMESLNRTVATMSPERLNNMINTNPALLNNPNVASRLSAGQVDTMRQSGNLTAAQMDVVTRARNTGLGTIATNGSLGNENSAGGADPVFQDRQRRALFRNAQEAGRLPANVLGQENIANLITPQIVEEFMRNNPNEEDLNLVRLNVQRHVNAPGAGMNQVRDSWENWMDRTPLGRRFAIDIH